MRIFTYLVFAFCMQMFLSCGFSENERDYQYASRLYYARPAINWNEALPVGNGRLGAMIYGGAAREHLSLNEQTLWSGGPRDWNNPEAKKYLPLVREAVHSKNYKMADSLSKFMQGPYTESYLPLGDVNIRYHGVNDSTNYKRELDLDKALGEVQFMGDGKTYFRTTLSSFPDQVIVHHDSCSLKGSISYTATLSSKLHYTVTTLAPNHIVLKGKCPRHVEPAYLWKIKDDKGIQYDPDPAGEGMTFEIHMIIQAESGKVESSENTIKVSASDATTLIISAGTSYNGFDKSPGREGKDPSQKASADILSAGSRTYAQLKQRHISDYQPIFRRINLNLGPSRNSTLPTDERLKLMSSYIDPELVATISQYGRYLLIAGSRPGGQPVNLKGIWNDKVRPEYSSNWCIDHDAQMFYYPVETNNLSEMHEPFLQFIEDLSVNGTKTALTNYGMNGWCAHHNADIWRQSGPAGNYGEGNPHWATWNMSGPWLSAHLYEHYLFTGDIIFLKQKAWPVMKGAAMFCLDWLTPDKTGKLSSVPSVSPENTFITQRGDTAQISVNTTSDIALIKELFTNCIRTAELLNIDKEFTALLKKSLTLLPAYKTGSKGQLLEWEEEWQPVDPAHRHLSHMYPVYPGGEISPHYTPELSEAAKKALTLRKKTNGTWGFAWKAACWARLGEGDSAWQTLSYQLKYVDARSRSSLNNLGLYPNLFNSEAPATILNGNACTTAAITEMILQSHTGEINFLPALPATFPSGTMSGVCARGGFIVDITWKNMSLSEATIYSTLGNECRIFANTEVKVFQDDKEIQTTKDKKRALVFKTTKGSRYQLKAVM